MKLVEILARELGEWPHACKSIFQTEDGSLWKKMWFDLNEWMGQDTLSSDFQTSVVTQSQWQAERDRMKAMEKIEQGVKQFENDVDSFARMVGAPLQEPTYEQQLWDRAYWHAWAQIPQEIMSHGDDMFHVCTQGCARMADAFMEERAKRVGK